MASKAFGWNFASTVLTKVANFGIAVMLARLLGPHSFGTFAVAYVAVLALQTFDELGVSLAIIRWEGEPDAIIPTVNTVSVCFSLVVFVGCFFLAPVYARAMGAPAAVDVVRVLAAAVLIDGFANTPKALLQRRFRQGPSVAALQIGGWLGTAVTVALAWAGFGAMSLAIGQDIGAAVVVILLVTFVPESLRFGFDFRHAGSLFRYGLPLAGSNLAAFVVSNVDQVVVGHMLGPVSLGLYVLASNLASWPINIFSQPVANVAPAVFARLQRDRLVLRGAFLAVAGLLAAIAFPVCLLISGSARPLVGFVYGARWLPASRPLICLAIVGAMQVFFLVTYDYLGVLGRSRFLLLVQLTWLAMLIPALVVGVRMDGIFGAGLAEVGVAVLGVLPLYCGGLRRSGLRFGMLARELRWPTCGAALVGAVAESIGRYVASDIVSLAASSLVAVTTLFWLAYPRRNVLARFRPRSVVEDPTGSEPGARTAEGRSTSPSRWFELADAEAGEDLGTMPQVGAMAQYAFHDVTAPLPIFRDGSARGLFSYSDTQGAAPLYVSTAEFFNLDPANRLARLPHTRDGERVSESGLLDRLLALRGQDVDPPV